MNLDYEKMYSFRYKAKGEGYLDRYDKSPLIFILDIQGDIILGINIHWIPKNQRQDFINRAEEIIGKTQKIGKKYQRMRLMYQMLKEPKFRNGLQAVRKYITSNMTLIKPIPRAKWEIVLDIKKYRMRIAKKNENYKI